ncbi:MAG: hypothetical protein PHQ35_08915 [Phycisphaerae bacterium]|nr:hypothetical protein [Phycisphaerae bacterium]MDD5381608.1 hypothetical protein [Phycisphaerae bacterium]
MGKNRKFKRQVPYSGHSHVAKTAQERSEYDDLVRTAPTTDPTDEIQAALLGRPEAEPVEPPHATDAGVKKRRTRIIPTKPTQIPWTAISSIIGLITLVAIIVASHFTLKSKVEQIDSLVVESKTNNEKIRDDLVKIREKVAQLEVKIDTVPLTPERSERYLKEIESIKNTMADMQTQSKELKEVIIRKIEQRIEQLEMEISREKKKTRR